MLAWRYLERANQKRGFAADAADALDVETLKARLEAVLAGGDKGAIFAHWMGGQRRRGRILERRRENAPSGAAAVGAPPVSITTELDDVLGRMREAIDGGRTASEIEAAKQRSREALDVQETAYLARREQSSVYAPQYSVPGG